MADLSAIIKQNQMQYQPVIDAQVNGLNQSYAQNSAADKALYNNQLAQGQQTLAQVPQQFNGYRNAADITKNQAMGLLPSDLANAGAATDSGANYQATSAIGNAFQNSMNDIGKQQETARQNAQNNINNINANEAASQAKLRASQLADIANARATTLNNIISNSNSDWQSALSREEQAREANQSNALSQQELGEKQREFNQSNALENSEFNFNKQKYNDAVAASRANAGTNANAAAQKSLTNIISPYVGSYTNKGLTQKVITNPDDLLLSLANSGLSQSQIEAYIDAFPYKVGGQNISLRHYINNSVSGGNKPNSSVVNDPLGLIRKFR